MKVWITKYALSGGVEHIEADVYSTFPDMVADASNSLRTFHGEGRHWHRTAESAKARAEELRVAKIASLKKQVAKLEKLTFDHVKD